MGSFESTENLLMKALPKDRVSQIMEEIRGPAGRTMWDKLGNVSEEVLANYLKNEYPQTVAVVLSKIKPDHAARVLTLLPDDFAMEVVMRMLRMESVQKDVLERVERTLRTEFMSNLARASRQRFARDDGRDLQQLRPQGRDPLPRRPGRAQPRVGREDQVADVHLRRTWQRLTPAGLQVLLRQIDKEKLPLALKGATGRDPQHVPFATVRARGEDAARRHGSPRAGQAEGRRGGAGRNRQSAPRNWRPTVRSNSTLAVTTG